MFLVSAHNRGSRSNGGDSGSEFLWGLLRRAFGWPGAGRRGLACPLVALLFAGIAGPLFGAEAEPAPPLVTVVTPTLAAKIDELLARLLPPEAGVPSDRLRVIVGDFPCYNAGCEGFSTLSRVLEDEFANAVTRRKGLELITRDKLEALLEEKKLGDLNFLDPRTAPTKIVVKAAEILVSGHYLYSYPSVSVKVEALRLHGGTVAAALTETVSLGLFPNVDVLPKEPSGAVANRVLPQKAAEARTNREAIDSLCRKLPNRALSVELWVASGRTHFQEGERLTFAVRAARDCYIAVFCHQVDGNTVLLFPNPYSGSARLARDQVVQIPGAEKENFFIEVEPPFGGDVVQVIASTRKAALGSLIGSARPAADSPFAVLARGVFAQGLQSIGRGEAGGESEDDVTVPGPTQYGEAHLVVNTYPK